jgi:hypothetical protein
VAVHAHVGAAWGQVGGHAAGPGAEVLEGLLGVDAALDGVALQESFAGSSQYVCGKYE